MNGYAGRLTVHDREIRLEPYAGLTVGDTLEVIGANGPREGDRMGAATVTGFENGSSVVFVELDGDEGRQDGVPP